MKTKMVKGIKRRCYADGGLVDKIRSYGDAGRVQRQADALVSGTSSPAPAVPSPAAPPKPADNRVLINPSMNELAGEGVLKNTKGLVPVKAANSAENVGGGDVVRGAGYKDGYSSVANRSQLRMARRALQYAKGGKVPGRGNEDTVPAMLTPGEVVMSKPAVKKYGAEKLLGMNARARRGLQRRVRR